MKRFQVKKLLVLSDTNKISKEVEFTEGLNIIIGENKTGKSSIIKSIFYSLGCEVKLESDWKKLIDRYLLIFQYGSDEYCVIRSNKNFKVYNISKSYKDANLIIDTDHFHEYSQSLMQVLEVTMDCITNKGQEVCITPPMLFRFQYIDQDKGWGKIGESFTNMQYIMDWKNNSNKYVLGYQDEEFYKTKKDTRLCTNRIDLIKSKLNNYDEFINNLTTTFSVGNKYIYSDYIESDLCKSKELIEQLNVIEKMKISIEVKLSLLRNQRYEKFLEMEAIKKDLNYLNEDHKFAMSQEDIIICPFCGAKHSNSIQDRIEIVKDIQSGNDLVGVYRKDIRILDKEIQTYEIEKNKINDDYQNLRSRLGKIKEGASIINSYKNEGKQEVLNTSKVERIKVRNSLDSEELLKLNYIKKLSGLISNERKRKITNDFKNIYQKVLSDANIPTSYIKLSNFVQVLTKTGSELPRIILAYQVSLYLYNLDKGQNPFNWIAIDTPNQQGQDGKNLKNIDSILKYLLTKQGQAILGTERETGFEDDAINIIKLMEYKKCLSSDTYYKHVKFIDLIEKSIERSR